MQPKIAELFFYEELSRIAGHETSSQWLLKQCTGLERSSSRKRQASSGSSTPCRTPVESAPASPRVQHQYNEAKKPAVHRESTISSSSGSSSTMRFDVDSSTPMDQAMKRAAARLSPSATFKSDSSMIGLIFTDAAHTVLDHPEVFEFEFEQK